MPFILQQPKIVLILEVVAEEIALTQVPLIAKAKLE
jgi:hypothetical protein